MIIGEWLVFFPVRALQQHEKRQHLFHCCSCLFLKHTEKNAIIKYQILKNQLLVN